MPHIGDKRYAVVSCHVERPLDDRTWARFAALQRRRPGGFAIAALLRPPDLAVGEPEGRWVERAHEAARAGPLGHHTHFGGVSQARPVGPGAVERVRRETAWFRSHGLEPLFFCGGAWYLDPEVAEALSELGYADCTGTAFRPAYLPPGAPRVEVAEPTWLRLPNGRRLLELPTTHSLGMLARAVVRPAALREPVVHAYFHDTDLLEPRRQAALEVALRLLGRRRRPTDLLGLAVEAEPGETDFARVYAR